MSEKKEKQWAVIKTEKEGTWPLKIVWFDARKTAREYAADKNKKSKRYDYTPFPMTRGPGA